MAYDFFNTSNTAFGSRLTGAFLNLNKLADDAEIMCKEVFDRWDSYMGFIGRNYLVPRPTDPANPVRANELYELLGDLYLHIQKLEYKNGKLNVIINKFTPRNNRISKLSLSTSDKEGYIFYKESVSNQNPVGTLKRYANMSEGIGTFLFQYRVGNNNIVNLVGDLSEARLLPFDFSQYSSISSYDVLKSYPIEDMYKRFDGQMEYYGTSKSFTYKPSDDECILAIGSQSGMRIKRGSTVISQYGGYEQGHFVAIYAKAGETYTFDNCIKILRIKYSQKERV